MNKKTTTKQNIKQNIFKDQNIKHLTCVGEVKTIYIYVDILHIIHIESLPERS